MVKKNKQRNTNELFFLAQICSHAMAPALGKLAIFLFSQLSQKEVPEAPASDDPQRIGLLRQPPLHLHLPEVHQADHCVSVHLLQTGGRVVRFHFSGAPRPSPTIELISPTTLAYIIIYFITYFYYFITFFISHLYCLFACLFLSSNKSTSNVDVRGSLRQAPLGWCASSLPPFRCSWCCTS